MLAKPAMLVVVLEIAKNGFDLSDWDRELVGAIHGISVADRVLPGPVKRRADEAIFVGGHR